jgi:hypothetical protein
MDLNIWLQVKPQSKSWIFDTLCICWVLMAHPGYLVITLNKSQGAIQFCVNILNHEEQEIPLKP